MEEILSAAGHRVFVQDITPPGPVRRTLSRLNPLGPRWDLAIHTERMAPEWMDYSRLNVFLTNPEWFEPAPAFSRMDAILCKTRWTVEIMSRLHPRAVFAGFTGLDRRLTGITREGLRPLHVVGSSPNKGTGALIEVWRRNPAWPTLTVAAWRKGLEIPQELPANVQVIREFIDDVELRRLQCGCGFHICPSSAEGFGHTIVEGLSTGAVVLTTDAPPMNELVSSDRGVLVPWATSEPMCAGQRFLVDEERLEEQITQVFSWPTAQVQTIGRSAREWFEQNDADFRRRFVAVVGELLQ